MYIDDMVQVTEVIAKSILTPQKFGSLAEAYDFSLNPYAGCQFACSYCYVPKFPASRNEVTWGSWVQVKMNAPQLIRKERALVFGSRIFFSSATDPYQYLELKYRLSQACLQELLLYKPAKLTMHTRSHLILKDLDLLKSFGPALSVGVSITSDDENIIRKFEPKAPALARRLELLQELQQAGINTFISLAPLLPHNPERLLEKLSPFLTGMNKFWMDRMHWPEVNTKPELLSEYKDYFADESYERQLKATKALLIARGLRANP